MRTLTCEHYRRPDEACAHCDPVKAPAFVSAKFWVAVALLAFAIGLTVVANVNSTDERPADNAERIARQHAEAEKDARQLAEAREYVISEFATGYARLGLEYGISIDQHAFTEMLIESDFLADESDLTVAQMAGWVSSPADLAATYKEAMLDDGESPAIVLQKWADRIEQWQAKTR